MPASNTLSHTFSYANWSIELSGRIDQVIPMGDTVLIRESKHSGVRAINVAKGAISTVCTDNWPVTQSLLAVLPNGQTLSCKQSYMRSIRDGYHPMLPLDLNTEHPSKRNWIL